MQALPLLHLDLHCCFDRSVDAKAFDWFSWSPCVTTRTWEQMPIWDGHQSNFHNSARIPVCFGTYRSDQMNGHCMSPQEHCEEILQNNYELKCLCSRFQSWWAMRLSSQNLIDIPSPTATLQLAALSSTKAGERRLQGNECWQSPSRFQEQSAWLMLGHSKG